MRVAPAVAGARSIGVVLHALLSLEHLLNTTFS